MSFFAQAGVPSQDVALHERSREQRTRLNAVSAEIDRIWETLRERAERIAHRHESTGSGQAALHMQPICSAYRVVCV